MIQRLNRDIGVQVVFIGNSSPFVPRNNFHSTPFGWSMNPAYETLARDGNPNTCYQGLEDLATKDGTHFTAHSNDQAWRRIASLIHSLVNGRNSQCN